MGATEPITLMHQHILIEAVSPSVDGGRYAAKGTAGEPCVVEADIFRDGESVIRAVIQWQRKGDREFFEARMEHVENDRFRGEFPLTDNAFYHFTIVAWTDHFASWRSDFGKK